MRLFPKVNGSVNYLDALLYPPFDMAVFPPQTEGPPLRSDEGDGVYLRVDVACDTSVLLLEDRQPATSEAAMSALADDELVSVDGCVILRADEGDGVYLRVD